MISTSRILPPSLNKVVKADETKIYEAVKIFKENERKETHLSDSEVVEIFRKSSNIKELSERLKHTK